MGYTKKWTPPTIPLRDDLAAWKTLFNDVHANLIAAGLVQTATAGQLVIDDVSALPADDTFAGFIEYAFDDALQSEAPVIIKLEYGCGFEGFGIYNGNYSWRTRTPHIRVTVFFKGQHVGVYRCPQASGLPNGGTTTQLTDTGSSFISHDKAKGWLGLCYGAASRNKPFASWTGNYYGATLTLFIQRQLSNENGMPTHNGLAVYYPNITTGATYSEIWNGGVLSLSGSAYCNGATSVNRTDMSPRIGRDGFAGGVDSVLLEPIYFPTNPPTPFPYLYSYRNTAILAGTEFEFNSVVGAPLNFIAIGNETSMSIDSVDGQRAGIAMLFE
jgi:hypothetical protein